MNRPGFPKSPLRKCHRGGASGRRFPLLAAATGILGLALALGALGWPDALSQVVRRTPMGGATLTDGDDPRAELIVKALVAFVIAGGAQWLHR